MDEIGKRWNGDGAWNVQPEIFRLVTQARMSFSEPLVGSGTSGCCSTRSSAEGSEQGLVLGQRCVDGNSNEITAVPVSDRIGVFRRGRLAGVLNRADASQERLMQLAS